MTFGEIKKHLLDLGSQDSGGDFEKMVSRSVNLTYGALQGIVSQDDSVDEVTLTTVANTSQYGLPMSALRILNIDDGTNNRSLEEISSREYDSLYPGTATSGTPRRYYVLWRRGVQTNLSAARTVAVVSSSTADAGGDYTARLQGQDSNGVWQNEQLELNGTTTVTSSNTYTKLMTVSTAATTGNTITGRVTVSQSTEGTVLARIPPSVPRAEHLWVEFYPIPDGALSLTVRVEEKKPVLVNDDDWPQIDERFHRLLVDGPGSELMIAVGKPDQALRMATDYTTLLKAYKGTTKRRFNKITPFADIQSVPISSIDRPLVEGVDFA